MDVKYEEVVFEDREATIVEMAIATREAMKDTAAQSSMKVWPWTPGEVPSIEDILFHYKDSPTLEKHFIRACLLLRKPIPSKYKNQVQLTLEPEKYFQQLDATERQLKISFELFLSESPTLEQAAQKLIQLSADYWGENLSLDLAEKQIKEAYPQQVWK